MPNRPSASANRAGHPRTAPNTAAACRHESSSEKAKATTAAAASTLGPSATADAIAHIVLIAFVAALLLWPASAHAASLEPTLGLTELETKLEASGTLPGYFKTVVQRATIETIPATVLAVAVAPNASLYGMPDQLVLFEATGPVIAKYGGIASGMSGSPLIVDDRAAPASSSARSPTATGSHSEGWVWQPPTRTWCASKPTAASSFRRL